MVQQLSREFWQTEVSAARHCRREAARLELAPPALALIACAEHADDVLRELPEFALHREVEEGATGAVLGRIFSAMCEGLSDRWLTSERSYRTTLLGLRHGVDLAHLMRDRAHCAQRTELEDFLERWLRRRIPLVEGVASELAWFADKPEYALENARSAGYFRRHWLRLEPSR